MPTAKPVVLTTATTNPAPNKAPEPLLVISAATAGAFGGVVKQAAEANQAAATLPADFAGVQTQLQSITTKLNNVLAKLRSAGILLP